MDDILSPRVLPSRRALVAALLGGAALAGCSSAPQPAFDLSAPRGGGRRAGGAGGQVVVAEPTALQPLEAERILVKDAAGSLSYLAGGQWADRLPRLIQARLIETFENTSLLRAVSRPGDGVQADYQLSTELRAFQLDASTGQATVELSAKLVALKAGQIVRARIFRGRVPVGSASAPEVAQALDRALGTVLIDIVRWIGSGR